MIVALISAPATKLVSSYVSDNYLVGRFTLTCESLYNTCLDRTPTDLTLPQTPS